MKTNKWLFLLPLSLLLHILLSWIGYNPTDDGFVLAISKRLLNGEIPHRDFISIRPVGSSIFHLPFLFFGDYCLWISRYFVILQWLIISSASLSFIQKNIELGLSRFEEYFWITLIFICCLHQAPLLAWTTIDGIFFSIIGFNLLLSKKLAYNYAGLLFIGCTVLTKQVYLPLLFVPLIMSLNIPRTARLLTFLPAILYVFSIWFNDGLSYMIMQFSARSEFIETGILSYIKPATILGVIYVICIPVVVKRLTNFFMVLFLFLPIIGYIIVAFTSPVHLYGYTLFPFGTSAALFVYSLIRKELHVSKLLFVITAIAWTASISLGYNFPIYFSGALLCCNFFVSKRLMNEVVNPPVSYALILCFLLPMFFYLRFFLPYREVNIFGLKYSLSNTMKGARFIHTNANTYNYITEINKLSGQADSLHKRIAIIPSFPGYWISSKMSNPIKVDWANHYEAQGLLLDSLCSSMNANKTNLWILVDKHETKLFSQGLILLKPEYGSVDYVKQNGNRIVQGEYVDVYELK
jgi:hypothetical protein